MSTADPYPSTQRVAPRKRHRVSRACDRCKKRKIRCSGNQPCEVCIRDETSCIYAAPHNRGRRLLTPIANNSSLSALSSNTQHSLVTTTPTGIPIRNSQEQQLRLALNGDSGLPGTITTETSTRVSPEPITDLQGHYVGPAAGVSFLARVRKRLHYGDFTSSTFTFADAPLPECESTPPVMITMDRASQLLEKFFEFTVPIDRLFHRPTIEQWFREFYDTLGSMDTPENAPARRGTIWIIFAMAQEHMPVGHNDLVEDKAIRYFLAADYQLSKERGVVNLVGVRARLYQCFWLLSRSRINHCWSLFGTTARLALQLGLHRKEGHHPADGHGLIDHDLSRRTFWSAYCLDIHLSLTLGRPRIFHDEDIDQEMPHGIDDNEFSIDPPSPSGTISYSVNLAAVSYYKLHRILGKVLRDIYSIQPVSATEQCIRSHKYLQEIREWRSIAPGFLQLDSKDVPPLIPIFQRQREVLKFTYWHAVIVTCRPLLLQSFTHRQQKPDNTRSIPRIHEGVKECLHAAMLVVDSVIQMFESGRMFRSFWATCYYGFSAAAILYVYTIQQALSSPETYRVYLDAATRFQGKLSTLFDDNSLVARYYIMLEELRLEVLQYVDINSTPGAMSTLGTLGTTDMTHMASIASESENIFDASSPYSTVGRQGLIGMPMDMRTWMQFETLAVPSFAGFESLTGNI
ncbi:fungal-specific transcription factor domain-containing protein [Truncatella angustata]|uniref:Fungal-specific transcription factor domain-containing protein n=1 Tax=Truncatella angustata TaxID=152316 RepID=A0A9P9A3C5_9PEZI|nr:fungal-specific transcription factor domain-containing protein [Truncatella angustata]KAH6660317.1 fungal-specific transcription factor domain-containing protein [Truncatella angustata]